MPGYTMAECDVLGTTVTTRALTVMMEVTCEYVNTMDKLERLGFHLPPKIKKKQNMAERRWNKKCHDLHNNKTFLLLILLKIYLLYIYIYICMYI